MELTFSHPVRFMSMKFINKWKCRLLRAIGRSGGSNSNTTGVNNSIAPTSNQNLPLAVMMSLHNMMTPILDHIATTPFNLETKRVEDSFVVDNQGRTGERGSSPTV